jgi:hypothetical protein
MDVDAVFLILKRSFPEAVSVVFRRQTADLYKDV